MPNSLFGSELVDYNSPAADSLREDLDQRRRGLFSDTERRMLWGMKSYEGHKNPNASERAKKHQIRQRIRNGLEDLAQAAALLPTEEWEQIVKKESDIPKRQVLDEPSGEFRTIINAVSGLTGTLAYAADGVSESGIEVDNAVANGIAHYHRLTDARERAIFADWAGELNFTREPGTQPLFQNAEAASKTRRLAQYRVDGVSRRRLLRTILEK